MNCRHFLGGHVPAAVRLVEGMNLDEAEFRQTTRRCPRAPPSRLVLVQHDDDLAVAVGVLPDQLLLRG